MNQIMIGNVITTKTVNLHGLADVVFHLKVRAFFCGNQIKKKILNAFRLSVWPHQKNHDVKTYFLLSA